VGDTFVKGLLSLKWTKWIIAAALVMNLCIFPAQAEGVDGIVKQLVLADGTSDGASMTCAQIVPENGEGVFALYAEFYHLAKDLWLEVSAEGNTVASTFLTCREGMASARILLEDPAPTQSLTFSFLDQPGGKEVYQPVATVVGFSANLPFEAADAMACTPEIRLSIASKTATVLACLLPDTEASTAQLFAQMVDQEGTVYGTAAQPALIRDCTVPDSRFCGIFRENPYTVPVQGLSTQIQLSKMPLPGSYDLIFTDALGAERYRFSGVIQCDDRPVAQLLDWTENPIAGAPQGAVTLFLANGAPEDFSLELYRGTTLLAQSEDFCALEYDHQTGGVYLSYSFAPEQPLVADGAYIAKIKSEQSYHGDSAAALSAVSVEAGTIHRWFSGFDSAYFANVLLKTQGFVPQRQYKATLSQNGTVLAESLVTTDERGLFDISFTDRQGVLISITPGQAYDVALCDWRSGGQWVPVDQIRLYPEENAPVMTENPMIFSQAIGLPVERILVHDRISVVNGTPDELRFQLFGQQNQRAQPDFFEILTKEETFTMEDPDQTLFSAQRYRAVVWCDDRIVGVHPAGYWVNARCMADFLTMQQMGIPNFEIRIAPTEHGTIRLFGDNGTPVQHENWLNFTEIYVDAQPDEGYVLDEIRVNDKPIAGRAFLLAENARVTATFVPRQTERFAIALRHGEQSDTGGGLLACVPETAALGDVVTLTARPNTGFTLNSLRLFETESGLEVPLKAGDAPHTWTFEMPGTAVTAEATFQTRAYGQIVASYDTLAGTVLLPNYAWEGDTVTVTVAAYEGFTLEELWLAYDVQGQEKQENLLSCPGEAPGTYCFTMPSAQTVWIRPVYREHLFTVSALATAGGTIVLSHTIARPGTTVTVTAIPQEQYRLVEGSVKAWGADQTPLSLTKTEKAGTWSFVMPWQNVQVSADFEGTAPEIAGCRAEWLEAGQMKFTIQMKNATPAVSLVAALYDGAGRLLDAHLVPCASGVETEEITLSCAGTAISGRVFLVHTASLAPRSNDLSIVLPQ